MQWCSIQRLRSRLLASVFACRRQCDRSRVPKHYSVHNHEPNGTATTFNPLSPGLTATTTFASAPSTFGGVNEDIWTIPAIQKAHGETATAILRQAGRLQVRWLAAVDGTETLIGSGAKTYSKAGHQKIVIRLNQRGEELLVHAHAIRVTTAARFTSLDRQATISYTSRRWTHCTQPASSNALLNCLS